MGRHGLALPTMGANVARRRTPGGAVIHYQDPDGKPAYSAEPRSTPDGRPWRAVPASEDVSFDDAPAVASSTDAPKILYYRNPMGLPDIKGA